jgi:hypothetical protein
MRLRGYPYQAIAQRSMGLEDLGQPGRSPLKYTNRGVCISLEKKVCALEESLDFRSYSGHTFTHWPSSLGQNSQKSVAIVAFWRPKGQTFPLDRWP